MGNEAQYFTPGSLVFVQLWTDVTRTSCHVIAGWMASGLPVCPWGPVGGNARPWARLPMTMSHWSPQCPGLAEPFLKRQGPV